LGLKAAHAVAELINLPDDVKAQHEERLEAHRLGVEAAPDQVNHLQLVGTAEAPDLNNPIARLIHGRFAPHGSRRFAVCSYLMPVELSSAESRMRDSWHCREASIDRVNAFGLQHQRIHKEAAKEDLQVPMVHVSRLSSSGLTTCASAAGHSVRARTNLRSFSP
jgi:hypothetical protein